MLLWQDGTDTNGLTLVGGATSTVNTFNGMIYAPNSQIEIYGFSNTIITGDIVANIDGILSDSTRRSS